MLLLELLLLLPHWVLLMCDWLYCVPQGSFVVAGRPGATTPRDARARGQRVQVNAGNPSDSSVQRKAVTQFSTQGATRDQDFWQGSRFELALKP